jgi:ribosome maturation factor RimP
VSLEKDIKNVVESLGLSLYDIVTTNENGETIYRISLTTVGGVSLDQCAQVTHLISPLLDVNPPISGEYRLEVSSPGIERSLKTLEHFKTSVGEKVSVTTTAKEKLRGELISVEGDVITLNTEDGEAVVNYSDINKARTYFEW